MWIETTNVDSDGNPVTRRVSTPDTDGYVEFTENGKAQVTADVGEQLIDHYETIRAVDASDGEDDEDTTSDAAADDEADDTDGE